MSRLAWVLVTLCACRPALMAEPAAAAPTPAAEPTSAEPAAAEPVPEPAVGAAPAAYELDGDRLVLPGAVQFAATLDSPGRGSEVALEYIRSYLQAKATVTQVRIEGHVDGPDAQAKSERRALAVARWLVHRGIDCSRLVPVGFGDRKPRADGSTPEGQAQNTRIEVHNVALRGRLIGGLPAEGGGEPAGDPCP